MPQINVYCDIIIYNVTIMQSLTIKPRQPEPSTILAETPVQEREKIRPEILTRQNTCAMDMIGLSWIFVEDDYA
jgi:hypothetical protein